MVAEVKPTGTRVLMEPDDPMATTASGLVVPDVAQKSSIRGKVIAVGEQVTSVRPGQRIVTQRQGGTDLPEYKPLLRRLVREEDVWAVEV